MGTVVGPFMRKARLAAGFTQKQLAETIGVKHNTISDWENERTSPSADQIVLLCDKLEISADILLGTEHDYLAISYKGQRIGRLYDKADQRDQTAVETILSRYDDEIAYIPTQAPDMEVSEEIYPERKLPLHILPASAGDGLFLDSSDYDMVTVGPEVPGRASFGVRISGDSMEPDYPDGYIAWAQLGEVRDGEIGIYAVNSDGYIKKQGPGQLISLNPAYKPITFNEYDHVRVYGRVIAVTPNVYV
jgi:transcriptional regulator with XRE-family HTH domain